MTFIKLIALWQLLDFCDCIIITDKYQSAIRVFSKRKEKCTSQKPVSTSDPFDFIFSSLTLVPNTTSLSQSLSHTSCSLEIKFKRFCKVIWHKKLFFPKIFYSPGSVFIFLLSVSVKLGSDLSLWRWKLHFGCLAKWLRINKLRGNYQSLCLQNQLGTLCAVWGENISRMYR